MTEMVEVRRCSTLGTAEQYALVLAAVDIECEVIIAGDAIGLYVAPLEVERAREQLSLYERENTSLAPPRFRARPFLHGLDTAMAYCAVLLFFFAANRRGILSMDWVTAGAAQAGLILDGAWWRMATALSLHADFNHLFGNLIFGSILGLILAQLFGSGLAWLLILLAGILGNGLNAVVQPTEHTAIGASTSVFGALGVLSGYTQRSRLSQWRSGLRRWAPVAAGVMLLVFLGFGGERTDIGGHVAGFVVGVGLGFALAHAADRRAVDGPQMQWTCGALACGLFSLAWLFAIWA